MIDNFSWGDELHEHFGIPNNSEEMWLAVQRILSIGDIVTGRIVARAGFGVWLDIGVGYPALLEVCVIQEPDFTYALYLQGEWGRIGTELTAHVVQFRDHHNKQIYLVQSVSNY